MENGKTARRRILYLLLSILVACGIWLYVDLSNGHTVTQEFQDIPIEFLYESTLTDRGLMLVEDGTDMTIDLTLEGTRWDISSLDRSDIRVTVSLFDVTSAGEQRINWNVRFTDPKRFTPSNITTKNASFTMATVNISELYSRTVGVSCELVGNVSDPYSAGQVHLSHTEVEVRGLREDIDPIRYAKVTLDIGESAVETVSQELELQYYDKDGRVLDKSGIYSSVERVQATLPVFVTKELQLAVNFIDAPGARLRSTDYKIDPGTIMVSGDAAQLKNMETLILDNYDLTELGTAASENYTTTNYPIIMPEGCQNLSGVTRAALRIRFKDMTSASIETENISWLNQPEGKRVELQTAGLSVKVFGTEADVGALTGEDISVTVDLGDYASAFGTYTVPAEVSVNKGDVGISGVYQVQVTIREGAEEPPEPGDETPEETEG